MRYNWREGDDGGNRLWFVCVVFCICVFVCVERPQKNKVRPKESQCFLEFTDRVRLVKVTLPDNMVWSINDIMLV